VYMDGKAHLLDYIVHEALPSLFSHSYNWVYTFRATGNVATEDVLYALQGSPYHVVGSSSGNTINLEEICEIGNWISGMLDRTTVSRVGKAMLARRQSSKL